MFIKVYVQLVCKVCPLAQNRLIKTKIIGRSESIENNLTRSTKKLQILIDFLQKYTLIHLAITELTIMS